MAEIVCRCCVDNGCECQGMHLIEGAAGCDLPSLEAAAAVAARAAGYRSPAGVAAEAGPPGPLSRLLLHRVRCDQCFDALLYGDPDTGSCREGAGLLAAARAARKDGRP